MGNNRILLVDLDDYRRGTRVRLLESAGYDVDVRSDYIEAERLDHESEHDLIIVALHRDPSEAAAYTDGLTKRTPTLPILLLADYNIYPPRGTISRTIETGSPAALLMEVAEMLSESAHVRLITPAHPTTNA
jgi:AmiR/NasT family two-component response regulator